VTACLAIFPMLIGGVRLGMLLSPFVGTHRFVVRALKLDRGQLLSVSGYVPLGIIWT
jgi:hypothetical protein